MTQKCDGVPVFRCGLQAGQAYQHHVLVHIGDAESAAFDGDGIAHIGPGAVADINVAISGRAATAKAAERLRKSLRFIGRLVKILLRHQRLEDGAALAVRIVLDLADIVEHHHFAVLCRIFRPGRE